MSHYLQAKYLCVLLVLVCAPVLLGQADRGTITGLVTDPTGAAVPGVEISVRHTATNIETTATTGPTGAYTLMRLPIGDYTLTAKAKGFRTYEQKAIPVRVDQTVRIDIVLTVGDVQETVSVTGEAPLIQSESSEVGLVLESKQFYELPLTLGGGIRNPSNFIMLQPGVMPGATWEKHIGGGVAFTDQVYYDGIALSRGDLSNDIEVNPSVDAIAEFKLISNNYTAEFTHALAGVTSFTMKSGTNDLHGSAFFFNSIEKYNARNFFQSSKPPYKQNEYGGTIGGPVLIPKVYDGRNKTFFFFSWDQYYQRSPGSPGLGTVPTAQMLQGNFSEWAAAGRGSVFDPASTRQDASGKYIRDPFPGNTIPKNRWSSISSKMVAMHPQPTYPGLTNNYQLVTGYPSTDQLTSGVKIDHQLHAAHRLSGMFNWTDRPAVKCPGANNVGGNSLAGDLECHNVQQVTTRVVRLNHDWTASPNIVNRFSAGLSRFRNPNFSVHYGKGWPEKLGLKGVGGDLFPWVDFNHDYVRFGDTIASDNYFTNFTFLDTVSVLRSNHTLKMGVEVQRHRNNFRAYDSSGGNFQFNQLSTGLPGVSASGNAWASFLLGDVYTGSSFFPFLQSGNRNGYYSLWFNDDWKVTPKLTLNLGVRWEIQPPFTDPNNRLSYMDPAKPNTALGGIPGAYTFAGTGPGRDGWTTTGETHWKDIAPRFGFAYRVAKDTVIRGGYGIFFAQVITQGTGVNGLREGYNVSASFTTPDLGVTPAFNWDGGFPQNFRKPPVIDPALKNGQGATLVDRVRSTLVPYSQQYNFLIERQVGSTMSFSAGYVANLGRRIQLGSWNWAQVDPKYLSLGNLLTANILDPQVAAAGFGPPFPAFTTLWGSGSTLNRALRPFPQFNGVGQAGTPFGLTNYHSFQFKGEKRMSNGISFTVAYTASKFISDTSSFSSGINAMNYYNRKLDRSLDVTDQPQVLVFSYIYELPFGRGKRFLGTGVPEKVLGGWKVTAIHSYAKGTPIGVTMNNNLAIFNPSQRPNVVSSNLRASQSGSKFDPAKDLWLNPAAFATPAPFTFGNAPRYLNVRNPAILNESYGLLKDTRYRERFNWQFRCEMSNPFNRVVFGGPTSNFSSGSFGKIGGTAIGARSITLGLKAYF